MGKYTPKTYWPWDKMVKGTRSKKNASWIGSRQNYLQKSMHVRQLYELILGHRSQYLLLGKKRAPQQLNYKKLSQRILSTYKWPQSWSSCPTAGRRRLLGSDLMAELGLKLVPKAPGQQVMSVQDENAADDDKLEKLQEYFSRLFSNLFKRVGKICNCKL